MKAFFIINFSAPEKDYECYNYSILELDSNWSIISYGYYYTELKFLNGFIREVFKSLAYPLSSRQ